MTTHWPATDARTEVLELLNAGDWAAAVFAAVDHGLITDTNLIAAFETGHDVLELAGLTTTSAA